MNDPRIDELQRSTERVLGYIEDDEATGRKGLYSMLIELSQDVKAQERKAMELENRLNTEERVRAVKVAVWSAVIAFGTTAINILISIISPMWGKGS